MWDARGSHDSHVLSPVLMDTTRTWGHAEMGGSGPRTVTTAWLGDFSCRELGFSNSEIKKLRSLSLDAGLGYFWRLKRLNGWRDTHALWAGLSEHDLSTSQHHLQPQDLDPPTCAPSHTLLRYGEKVLPHSRATGRTSLIITTTPC